MTTPDAPRHSRPISFAIFLAIAGAVGWWAAFNLTVSKIEVLENPSVDLACDFSVLVQCGTNLTAWQGAVFGFPNPLLGMGGFVAPIAVGVGLLAGARFARWFWIAFNVGIVGAFAFVIWLISQSLYSLGTLCPWCIGLCNGLRRPGMPGICWVSHDRPLLMFFVGVPVPVVSGSISAPGDSVGCADDETPEGVSSIGRRNTRAPEIRQPM